MTKILAGDRIGASASLSVACSAVLFDESRAKILLTRRSDNGQWCMPGGGMNAGESASEACIREVWEETGLEVTVERLVGIYTSPHRIVAYNDGSRWQYVSLSFEVSAVGGELGLSNETTEFGYFSQEECKRLHVIEDHIVRVADAFAEQPTTLIR